MPNQQANPAETAGQLALAQMLECLNDGRSFRVEAGAGAGKTFSLEKALRHLIEHRGAKLLRQRQQVGCITFTNIAKDEIIGRTQSHPSIKTDTIHGFCWSALKDFQALLRRLVPTLDSWNDRLEAVGGIGSKRVNYDLGYARVADDQVSIRHDDVLSLMIRALGEEKFRALLTARYPILLIDEYQDTDAGFIAAIRTHFLETGTGPQIGLFGDHWQKIYGEGCGAVEHAALQVIPKNANFRSAVAIVQVLNRMRPALVQHASNLAFMGEARVFHTNAWTGTRRTGVGGGHWTGDTSPEAAKAYFASIKNYLAGDGWDFSANRTKILMLSHSVLAREQGYDSIRQIFGQYNEPWLKKEDPHIKFLADHLEPAFKAFAERRFGLMFQCFGAERPHIRKHADKATWAAAMKALIALRQTGTIGEVIDYIATQPQIPLPEKVAAKEQSLAEIGQTAVEGEARSITNLRSLRAVRYTELIALDNFIDGHTPFATKHGVKGAEFENVLVIVGRGWNAYNFVQMLEWLDTGPPPNKDEFFESNRNLFYVACSRPRSRLALLFTQQISERAMAKLHALFGAGNVIGLPATPPHVA